MIPLRQNTNTSVSLSLKASMITKKKYPFHLPFCRFFLQEGIVTLTMPRRITISPIAQR